MPRTVALGFLYRLQQLHRALGPDRPLSQQAAHKVRGAVAEAELGKQIGHDVVVVSGIEGDLGAAPAMRHRAQHFHGLVTVEGRNLDRDDRLDLNEPLPELGVQRPSPHGRLQIEADDGNGFPRRCGNAQ